VPVVPEVNTTAPALWQAGTRSRASARQAAGVPSGAQDTRFDIGDIPGHANTDLAADKIRHAASAASAIWQQARRSSARCPAGTSPSRALAHTASVAVSSSALAARTRPPARA
jgi:hypothetical protein